MAIISRRTAAANGAFDAVKNFYFNSRYGERRTDPGIADFTFGNPHEMPLDGIVAAIREGAVPQNKDWFAYKTSEDAPQAFLAREVGRELGLQFDPPDIALTAGAFAAISVAFRLVLDAGDEAIYSEPAWFCYEPMLLAADAIRAQQPARAAAGPAVAAPLFQSPPQAAAGPDVVGARLQELKRLYDSGFLTPDEYEAKRRQIIQQL